MHCLTLTFLYFFPLIPGNDVKLALFDLNDIYSVVSDSYISIQIIIFICQLFKTPFQCGLEMKNEIFQLQTLLYAFIGKKDLYN